MKMRKLKGASIDSPPLPINLFLKCRNIPVTCILPGCFRIMLKKCYRQHCTIFHQLSVEDDLPEFLVDSKLLNFL